MAQSRSTHRGAKGGKAKAPAARKANGIATHGDKLAHAVNSRTTATPSTGKASAATTPNGSKQGARKSGGTPAGSAGANAIAQPSGFLARAKEAVGNVVKRVTAGRKTEAASTSSSEQKKSGKRTG